MQVTLVSVPVIVMTTLFVPLRATVFKFGVVHALPASVPPEATTVYPVIVDPPDAGAVQEIVTLFPVATEAVTPVGTEGTEGVVIVPVPATLP